MLTVDVGNVEVVVSELRLRVVPRAVVLELSEGAILALVRLGNLDRDTDVVLGEVLVVLGITLARLEHHHLVFRTAVTLEDGPQINIVFAAVDDASVRDAQIARVIQGDGISRRCRGGCDEGGGCAKKGSKLHRGELDRWNTGQLGSGLEAVERRECVLNT